MYALFLMMKRTMLFYTVNFFMFDKEASFSYVMYELKMIFLFSSPLVTTLQVLNNQLQPIFFEKLVKSLQIIENYFNFVQQKVISSTCIMII